MVENNFLRFLQFEFNVEKTPRLENTGVDF